MKKTLFRFSAIFLAILVLFIGFPFNSLNRVKAVTNPATNFIDFLRTNLGIAKVDNGSLSALDRTDFVLSLYNTSLAWKDNDITFSFVPADVFTKNEWIALATSGTIPSPNFAQYDGYDLKQSLIMSDYIQDTGIGYDLSNMPELDDIIDTTSPLDGIEIKTNFADFNPLYSDTLRPTYNENFIDSLKNQFLSSFDNVIIFAGYVNSQTFPRVSYQFVSFDDSVEFYSFVIPNGNVYSLMSVYYYTNEWVNNYNTSNTFLTRPTNSNATQKSSYYGLNFNAPNLNYIQYSNLNFVDSSITQEYGGQCRFDNAYSRFKDNTVTFWSNKPVIIGSTTIAIQNYYYWINGVPDGSFYTTANTQTVYNYDYVNNNNWETAYNNYITDVSNFYNTSENITNEQLTQYIDNSTTITNITNNYIDNSGSGGGGDSPDSGLIVSWLEKIFDRVTDIYNTILGKDTEGDIYYNDNSIRYSIIEYPLSDLFPSVPQSRFIPYSDVFDFGIAQNHLNSVMRQIIPFCYLYQLQTISTALEAPPETPHYEIPFTIERLNIDEEIVIDLSAPAWTTLHSIWITLFTIMLITALLYATYKFLILLNSIFG